MDHIRRVANPCITSLLTELDADKIPIGSTPVGRPELVEYTYMFKSSIFEDDEKNKESLNKRISAVAPAGANAYVKGPWVRVGRVFDNLTYPIQYWKTP